MIENRFGNKLPMERNWSTLISLFVIALLTIPSSLNALEAKNNCQVEYVKGRLMIKAQDVALGPLLEVIRQKTGIEFVIMPEQSEKLISIQLNALPLDEGLKRILGNFNHAFLFSPDNKLVKVIILGYAGSDSPVQAKESNSNSFEFTGTQPPQGPVPIPSSAIMVIEPPPKKGMVITYSEKRMVVEPPNGKGMFVTGSMEESKPKGR